MPFLATDRLCRGAATGRPDKSRPLATVVPGGTRRLAAVNRAALDAGLRPGETVADAQARLPALCLATAEPAAEQALLEHLAEACLCYSPMAAAGDETNLWIDISGCAHLLGGEIPLLRDLVRRLTRYGFTVRVAVADSAGAAWAWARFGDPAHPCLPAGEGRRALLELPVAALRLDPAIGDGLRHLGLKTVAALEALPRAALASRFGDVVGARLDQLWGRVDEPLSPCRPADQPRTYRRFAEPIGRADDVAAAARQMLAALCQDLERRQQGVRRLELAAFRVDATCRRLTVGTGRPTRDSLHLFRLLAEPLGTLDAGFGIEMLGLAAQAVAPLAAEQMSWSLGRNGGEAGAEEGGLALAVLCDSLGNRLGFERLTRFVLRQSHLPERAVRRLALGQGDGGTDGGADGAVAGGVAGRRPVRLFERPEAVEAVAPLPDAPPLLFRWRHQIHRVTRAEGPERLSGEWWRRDERDRDYYCVEDDAGARFWLYREGAYDGQAIPRWFLHGIFP